MCPWSCKPILFKFILPCLPYNCNPVTEVIEKKAAETCGS